MRSWIFLTAGGFVATGIFLAARFGLQPRDSEIFLHQPQYLGGSLAMVFTIQPRIWTFLLRLIFWPFGLSADYVPQDVTWITLPAAGVVLTLFLIAQGLLAWKSRLAALGAAVFWLGLAPVSNFIPIFRPVADRFLYLPLAGLGMSLAGLFLLAAPRREALGGLAALALIIFAGWCSLAWQRQAVFANSLNLWTDTLVQSPFSDTAANNLGWAQIEAKNYAASLPAFEKALNLTQGRKADAWAGAAIAFESLGRFTDADNAAAKAVAAESIYAEPERLVAAMMMTRENAKSYGAILQRQKTRETLHPPVPE